ncbi:hypothetical protein TWF281_009880 [Arthrobotrys megalospora]
MEAPTGRNVPAPTRKRKFHEANPSGSSKSGKPAKTQDKRRKRQDAREISVQTSENAFWDGQFDPVSFVNAREYEIKSLLRSMNSSKNAQRKRAFQSLPRELRRRTAAHNPSRVPKRVRATAQIELADDNTTLQKKRRDYRPNARRLNAHQLRMLSVRTGDLSTSSDSRQASSKGPSRIRSRLGSKSSRYRKRQKHKTWLPTHIWCAKRARMVCKWGFSLADTPNLKCYRPTYRAATRDGCVAVDTSYYATILLEGQEKELKRSLAKFLPPRDRAFVGKSVISGESVRSTWMYEEGEWPNGALTPIQIFWCPESVKEHEPRKVVLRVHPASWDDAWKVATASTAASKCTCKNLRFEIGSIGLTGPRTVKVLHALLGSSFDFENMLVDRITYGSGKDPRLGSFYLRRQIPVPPVEEDLITAPVESLFNTKCRNASVNAQVSQKTLNSHVSRLVSGDSTRSLSYTKIPFVLMRELVGVQADLGHSNPEPPSSHRWSILLPWKWVRPFWLVLMRMTGVRLGGLKELEQLTLEGGLGYFPIDFPSTKAGRAEALEKTKERLDRAKRRSTMKTKGASKKSVPAAPADSEVGTGYPWDQVLETGNHLPCKEPKVWQLTPDLVRLFWKSSQGTLPPSLSSSVFAARIRVFGRGNIDPNAHIYVFSGHAARLVSQVVLQHSRDGNSMASVLEILDSEKIQLEGAGQAGKATYSLAGFVVRGNFGFFEAAPVAVAALAWAKVYEGEASSDQGSHSGWCILQNGGRGIKRLAQWTAI